jgi:hypothetical protein
MTHFLSRESILGLLFSKKSLVCVLEFACRVRAKIRARENK